MAAPRHRRPEDPGALRAQARYFVGLRPEAAVRRALAALAESLVRRCGGRPVPEDNVHLTLVFIGAAPRALEPELRALVAALPPAPPIELARMGSFDGRLLWLGTAAPRPPAALEALVAQLAGGLDALGVAFDRKPFRVHLTLVRGARRLAPPAVAALGQDLRPVTLGAARARLVESELLPGGSRHRWID
jgi:2'-5' RNA ligase